MINILERMEVMTAPFWHALSRADDGRWWELLSLAQVNSTSPSAKFEVTCDASFGNPKVANCASALFELGGSGRVVLDPGAGPLYRFSGDCAIGIESPVHQITTWDAIRHALEDILSTCISNPVTGVIGGFAISHTITSRKPTRRSDVSTEAPSFTVSMYLQEPFNGMPEDTCAWKVVSSHIGDVRQCPAPAGVWRPPERRLGENGTESSGQRGGNQTLSNAVNGTTTIAANSAA